MLNKGWCYVLNKAHCSEASVGNVECFTFVQLGDRRSVKRGQMYYIDKSRVFTPTVPPSTHLVLFLRVRYASWLMNGTRNLWKLFFWPNLWMDFEKRILWETNPVRTNKYVPQFSDAYGIETYEIPIDNFIMVGCKRTVFWI